MISFQVVQPFQYLVSADTVNDAIKNFVKIHRDLNISNIIITDQRNHYEARFKYFLEDGRNKVGINYYPFLGPLSIGPTYLNYMEKLPGATGIPLTPAFSTNSNSNYIWSPTVPYTPYGLSSYFPTIITLR